MKKDNSRKLVHPSIMAAAAAVLLSLAAFQALTSPSARADEAVFSVDGTDEVLLEPEQIQALEGFADTSKERLDGVVIDLEKLSVTEKNLQFYPVIRDVVVASYKHKKTSELLMRTVLVQALQLTYGLPPENGMPGAPGVLKSTPEGRAYPGLIASIMEDSIDLARNFYMDDRKAVKEGNLGDLPVLRLARDRLNRARDRWLNQIGDDFPVAYDLGRKLLWQWYGTAKSQKNMDQQQTAEEVRKLTSFLRSLPVRGDSKHPLSDEFVERNAREIRRQISWLLDRMNAREM